MNKNQKMILAFNKQLLSFIEQSPKVYPEINSNPQIQQSLSKLRVVIEISPEIPIIKFKKCILGKYDDLIKRNDDTFFDQFISDNESFHIFKEIYERSKKENKTIIWKYLKQFRTLAVIYTV